MPEGQWVAWEGYDTIHDCNNPPIRADKKTGWINFPDLEQEQEETNLYGELEFPDIEIEGRTHERPESFKQKGRKFHDISTHTEASASPEAEYPESSDSAHRWNIPEWLKTLLAWIIFFGVLILFSEVC